MVVSLVAPVGSVDLNRSEALVPDLAVSSTIDYYNTLTVLIPEGSGANRSIYLQPDVKDGNVI